MSEPEDTPVIFNAFDREAPVDISSRNLPHWYQPGAATFVTFRTADSLPQQAIDRMIVGLSEWLGARNLPLAIARSALQNYGAEYDKWMHQLDARHQRIFKKLVREWINRSLDECYGECLFKNPELAKVVADAIRYFDGVRYDLDSLVVMPNHVHVIVQFRKGYSLQKIGLSWMRYTARLINQKIGREGILWKPEPFDHIIRSSEQLEHLRKYIFENPLKAKLPLGEYLYWSRTENV